MHRHSPGALVSFLLPRRVLLLYCSAAVLTRIAALLMLQQLAGC